MESHISKLIGLTLELVIVKEERIEFKTVDRRKFVLYHQQDCCENVTIESIDGDIIDIIGSQILTAEEIINPTNATKPQDTESYTWTFYKIDTAQGGITIRFIGISNGYYSETVDFVELP